MRCSIKILRGEVQCLFFFLNVLPKMIFCSGFPLLGSEIIMMSMVDHFLIFMSFKSDQAFWIKVAEKISLAVSGSCSLCLITLYHFGMVPFAE